MLMLLLGSPPRMRGKHDTTVPAVRQYRITPAGAGKTRCDSDRAISTRDHPRRCGENLPIQDKRLGTLGSPPQVRGKLTAHAGTHDVPGITPAGAGKTCFYNLPKHCLGDHPRRCGENHTRTADSATRVGSPPQVRGKPAAQ